MRMKKTFPYGYLFMFTFLSITFFSLFWMIICVVKAEKIGKIQVIGKWDAGASYDAIAYGNYLYVASGSQVRIYDISTKEKIENIKMEYKDTYGGCLLYTSPSPRDRG